MKAKGKDAKWLIYRRDGGRCFYCKQELLITEMTIDHKQPKSKNGNNHQSNLVLSCEKCNKEKGIIDFKEFCKLKKIKVRKK
jgi:5-methylcytosine-specific restriction endonuclease McrA